MKPLQDISDFIFIENPLEKADIIFVPGSPRPENMEHACCLWKQGYAPYLLPSGKYSILHKQFLGVEVKAEVYNGHYETECDFLMDVAHHYQIPDSALIREDKATYTMENAVNSRKITDSMGLEIKTAILCCKSFHARRAFMYYQLAYPETRLLISPVNIDNITKANWQESETGISEVLGELGRIGSQFNNLIKDYKN